MRVPLRPIATEPSHDLSHLFVAANGSLPWAPGRGVVNSQLAEYNAVFVEYLLHVVYSHVYLDNIPESDIIENHKSHMNWFVATHYAPFPLQVDQAFKTIAIHLDRQLIVRLSPLFFHLHEREYNDRSFKSNGVRIEFTSAEVPVASIVCSRAVEVVRRVLSKLCHL